MSTATMARVVQDQALADGHGVAVVAVYGGLVRTMDHLFGEPDSGVDALPGDVVLQVARREVPADTVAYMADWLLRNAEWATNAAGVLDQLDGLEDRFPALPPGAVAYRSAAQELAYREGESAAAVAYAGAQAQARWLRLYGGRTLDSLHELAVADVVLEAARRELAADAKTRVTDWVHAAWERIDELATEAAAGDR